MTLQELLVERNLTSALIIDDAYDEVPRAGDLTDDRAWATFMDDVGADADKLRAEFPDYDRMDASALRNSDEFVAILWRIRERLSTEVWKPLFEAYEQATRDDQGFLRTLEAQLRALGITPVPSGRVISPRARDASIVFADLFLGASQSDADIELSVKRLKEFLADRESNPPLVILMSRSSRLNDKKEYFRDSVQLVGAMFRVYGKAELVAESTLELALSRLALHYPDAVRISAFLHAWERGLQDATVRFLGIMRRLDLPDYAQIGDLLLDHEGEPMGSYLLDVFDRVLQHEVEGDRATIDAAEALNHINRESYPAPYIAGTADLQDLVFRCMWQHPHRLTVSTSTAGIPVTFGDVLVRRSLLATGATSYGPHPTEDALVVLTPACDLVRPGGCRRIMLMCGSVATLDDKSWRADQGVKTPIVVFPDDRRMWIKWDVKNVRTLLMGELENQLAASGPYIIALRLRDSYALEIQQRLLASVGRVGNPARMPVVFTKLLPL